MDKYITMDGRFGRWEFLKVLAAEFVVLTGISFLAGTIGFNTLAAKLLIALSLPLLLLSFWFAVVKRLHDLNRSEYWSLIILVPLLNMLALFILLVVPGTQGDNPYGSDPTIVEKPDNPNID